MIKQRGRTMEKKWMQKKLFYKYLISYIVSLILPIIVLMSAFNMIGFEKLKKELFEKDIASLRVATYNLEKTLNACQNIATQMNEKYYPFDISKDIISAIEITDLLQSYAITNEIFDKIFMIFPEKEHFYYNGSSIRKSEFLKSYTPKNLTPRSFVEKLKILKTPMIFDQVNYAGKDYFFYSVPYLMDNEIVGQLLFLIKAEELYDIVGNETQSIKRVNHIVGIDEFKTDYKDTLSINGLDLDDDEWEKIVGEVSEGQNYHARFIEGNSIYITHIPSLRIVYLAITSNQQIFKELVDIKNIIVIIGCVVMAIGLIVVQWIARNNYRPIEQLKKLSTKCKLPQGEIDYHNEIEYIKQTIISLNKENERLTYEFEKNIPVKQNFLLNKLINGTVGEKKFFERECLEVNLQFKAPYHCIVAVEMQEKINEEIEAVLLVRNQLKDILQIEYVYTAQVLPEQIIIILVGSSSRNEKNKGIIECKEAKIAIGEMMEDIEKIPSSYVSARSQLELNPVKGDSLEVLNIQSEMEQYIKLSAMYIEKVQVLLASRTFNQLKEKVKEAVEVINQVRMPLPIIRNTYCEMVISFNKYLEKNKNKVQYEEIEISILYNINEPEALKEVFLQLLEEAVEIITQSNKKTIVRLDLIKIKECINKHYAKPEFSVQFIADEFETSISYLSQYFKEHAQMTILDYITLLRINKAKELMSTTNYNIQYVSEQIGYNNVSSFIRRFKQVTGQTPGEFKKLSKI